MNVKPGVGNVSSGVLSLSTPAVEFSSNPNQTPTSWSRSSDGVFKSGHIALLRALRHENNHGHHIEVSFQTEVLKISHFKGPLGMKDFEGYKWWTLRDLPWSFAWLTPPPYDTEGHFKKQLFGPLRPSNLLSSHSEGKPFEGIRA